jgi:hypothetical protein
MRLPIPAAIAAVCWLALSSSSLLIGVHLIPHATESLLLLVSRQLLVVFKLSPLVGGQVHLGNFIHHDVASAGVHGNRPSSCRKRSASGRVTRGVYLLELSFLLLIGWESGDAVELLHVSDV